MTCMKKWQRDTAKETYIECKQRQEMTRAFTSNMKIAKMSFYNSKH